MRHAAGAICLLLIGCILLPISVAAVLLMPRRDVEPWRPVPPPRR